MLCYRRDLEEHSEELIRIKECYVQLGEDSRGLEQKLREEFEKEKQMLLSEVTSTAYELFFIPRQTSLNVSSKDLIVLIAIPWFYNAIVF